MWLIDCGLNNNPNIWHLLFEIVPQCCQHGYIIIAGYQTKNGAHSAHQELLGWHIRQKTFLASSFTSMLCGPLNMHSSVSPVGPFEYLHGQKIKIERVIIDLVSNSWCFTDVSFTMVYCGETASWATRGFLKTVIPQEKERKKTSARLS